MVNLAALTGSTPYQVVYSATDGHGNYNSEVRSIFVVDLLSPQIIALATADGQVSPVTMALNTTIDPAVNTPAGYTVLEGRIMRELALEMAAAFLAHHTPDAAEDMHGAGDAYQTLFGMLNRDDRTWTCAAHR